MIYRNVKNGRGGKINFSSANYAVRVYFLFSKNKRITNPQIKVFSDLCEEFLNRTQNTEVRTIAADVYEHDDELLSSVVIYFKVARPSNIRAAEAKLELGYNFAEKNICIVAINTYNTKSPMAAMDIGLIRERGVSRAIEGTELDDILNRSEKTTAPKPP